MRAGGASLSKDLSHFARVQSARLERLADKFQATGMTFETAEKILRQIGEIETCLNSATALSKNN